MLYTPVNHFNWSVANFTLYPGHTDATTLTASASTHTKGTDTALLAGIAHDCWGIYLNFTAGDTTNTIRRQMVDILIDPAAGVGNAGSSWASKIDNVYASSPGTPAMSMGYQYYFPLFIPAGTAIGARVQDVVTLATVRCSMRVYGQPTRPDLVKVGTKVQTIGATTASTSGVAFTPGQAALGTYSASMGTLNNDAWWWQVGVGTNDATMNGAITRVDVAADVTAKYICMQSVFFCTNSDEKATKSWAGDGLPIRDTPAGSDVYVRGQSASAPDSGFTAVAYAVS